MAGDDTSDNKRRNFLRNVVGLFSLITATSGCSAAERLAREAESPEAQIIVGILEKGLKRLSRGADILSKEINSDEVSKLPKGAQVFVGDDGLKRVILPEGVSYDPLSEEFTQPRGTSSSYIVSRYLGIDIPGGWRFPVRGDTSLNSNADDHMNRGSVPAWDFWGCLGTLVYPARKGMVNYASYGNEGGYGHWIMIRHDLSDNNKWETLYCHLGKLLVSSGQEVDEDTPLGEIAQTGMTSWPHTHFEFRLNGSQVDPEHVYGRPDEIGLPYIFWSNLPYEKRSWDINVCR